MHDEQTAGPVGPAKTGPKANPTARRFLKVQGWALPMLGLFTAKGGMSSHFPLGEIAGKRGKGVREDLRVLISRPPTRLASR